MKSKDSESMHFSTKKSLENKNECDNLFKKKINALKSISEKSLQKNNQNSGKSGSSALHGTPTPKDISYYRPGPIPTNTSSHNSSITPTHTFSHTYSILPTSTSFRTATHTPAYTISNNASARFDGKALHSDLQNEKEYTKKFTPKNDTDTNIIGGYTPFCRTPLLSTLSQIFRSSSAPPDDSLLSSNNISDISYTAFYRKNSKSDIRLPVPSHFVLGSDHLSLSLLERIDSDHPFSESITYKGETSRSATPIGNTQFLKEIHTSKICNEFEEEIRQWYLEENACGSPITPASTTNNIAAKSASSSNFCINTNANAAGIAPSANPQCEVINKYLMNLKECNENFVNFKIEDKSTIFCDSINEKCLNLSMDQEGSRFIQKKLEKCKKSDLIWFFNQIKSNLKILSLDLFGNYVIQKLLELEIFEINNEILNILKNEGEELSLHMYGCRVIQKIFELERTDISKILESIRNNIVVLIEDQNGNHVVQKCVEKIKNVDFIVSEFVKNGVKLSKHKYGCRVVQRIFENCKDDKIKVIVKELSLNIQHLIEDQYGNYVLQHIIQNKEYLRDTIINEILNIKDDKIMFYCQHKFASNVIEKCVTYSDKFSDILLKQMNGKPMVVTLATDRYGNYVVQRVLEKKGKIGDVLRNYVNDLKKSVYAKHILCKIS